MRRHVFSPKPQAGLHKGVADLSSTVSSALAFPSVLGQSSAPQIGPRLRAGEEIMANIDKYEAGAFCWAELATSDDEGAKKFYTNLFGWDAQGNPMGEMGTYYMMRLGGREVCAMYKLGPQMKGVPPHWMTYISVENVDATVKKAESLGAKVMNPAMDVYDFGRMAVLSDPTGATFSLWQPKQHPGATVRGGNGTTCWNELI